MEAGVSLSGLQNTLQTVDGVPRRSLSDPEPNASASPASSSSSLVSPGTVRISAEAAEASGRDASGGHTEAHSAAGGDHPGHPVSSSSAVEQRAADSTEEARELAEIRSLSKRDREVRAHEAAHAAAGGSIAGAPSLDYTRGPDGRLYATAGEVSIDTSPVSGDPRATIEKARTIIQAALAPANPSPQDIQVAARAQAMLVEAQAEIARSEPESLAPTESGEAAQQQDEDQPDESPAAAEQNRDTVQDRLARSREQREAFADQLRELNSRVSEIQQRVIETGAMQGIDSRSTFLDLIV